MAQFDVHKNPAPSRARVPYLLDVQSDLLRGLATRVVIPLVRPAEVDNRPIRDLHFEVTVRSHRFIALGSELAAVPAKALGAKVASLSARRADVVRAIDLMISGV